MPVALVLLAIIALVLYILFGYLLPSFASPPAPAGWRTMVTIVVILVVLILWYVIPVHIGGQ
jgi:hypothetical protein